MRQKIRKFLSIALAFLVVAGVMPMEIIAAESSEPQIITGFEALKEGEKTFHILKSQKPSLDELLQSMPQTMEVNLNEEKELIDVTWYSVGEDYEMSDRYYFQFSPKWDEEKYILDESMELLKDAPYISVFLYDEETGISQNPVTDSKNEEIIYNFLIDEVGFSAAAACGVLANIYHESAFNPNTVGDNGTSYGICQWHDSRWDAMKAWCSSNGYDSTTLIGQLNYLKFELSQNNVDYLYNGKTIFNYMASVENTAQGAYDAGYYWCYYYEIPANKKTVSVSRGNLAKDTYWAYYSAFENEDPETVIVGHSVPGTLTVGNVFIVKGTIRSAKPLIKVSVWCVDVDGNEITGASANPQTTSYDIAKLDNYVEFNKIKPGIYFYRISATSEAGTSVLVNAPFIVLANSQTVTNGTYSLVAFSDSEYAVQVQGKSDESGANIELNAKKSSKYQALKASYVSGGYYTLQVVGSEKLLTVEGAGTTAGTNVVQSTANNSNSQKWQILPVGNSYSFVPKNATGMCLNIQGETMENGANIEINKPTISAAQRFVLTKTDGIYADDNYVETPENPENPETPFVDVSESSYYYDAVLWALENNVTAGKDDTHFVPDESCSRAQVVTFLWRAKGRPEPKTTKNPFVDVSSSSYYYKAVLWAMENGITAGTDATHFSPDATVNRSQFVTFLWRAEGRPTPTVGNPFVDVQKGTYYTDAILWALENNITAGKDATHFGPVSSCSRAQVVTFLYRAYKK